MLIKWLLGNRDSYWTFHLTHSRILDTCHVFLTQALQPPRSSNDRYRNFPGDNSGNPLRHTFYRSILYISYGGMLGSAFRRMSDPIRASAISSFAAREYSPHGRAAVRWTR